MNYSIFVKEIFKKSWTLNFSRVVLDRRPLVRNVMARRALLFVPGDNETKLNKALNFAVDSIVMDCEDCVSYDQKNAARQTIRKFLDKDAVNDSRSEWLVRVNPILSWQLCEMDLDAILSARNLPSGICLSGITHVEHLQCFSEKVKELLIKRDVSDRGPLKLIMCVDTPGAIMNLSDLCNNAVELSKTCPIKLDALMLGSCNLAASLGATKTPKNFELMYARQKLVLVAKAFGLQAIDGVSSNIENKAQLENDCKDGIKFGFTGKHIINPCQITITQEFFSPTRSKIKWAKSILKEFEKRQQISKDDYPFDDAAFNMPSVRQAQYIVNTALASKKKL